VVTPPRSGQLREWRYEGQDIRLAQGEEMGRFLLGSTVIVLWPRATAALTPDWRPGRPVRLGEVMATRCVSR
jgi:phosphatidylserine decarboxylase